MKFIIESQARAEIRADKADARMDRADARMDTAEARMDKMEKNRSAKWRPSENSFCRA